MLFGKSNPLFGLDIGSSAIKLVQLKESKGKYELVKFGIQPLDPELIVDGTVMDAGRVVEAIKALLSAQQIKTKDVVLSVSGHSVIVKKITLPSMTEDELEESIRWEAEQYIPFDINDVNLDFHILGSTDGPEGRGQMSVLLVAVKKDKLTDYTALVTEAGLSPAVVDVDAFALENMFEVNYGGGGDRVVALVNIGASVMNINMLKNGVSSFTRDISIGGNKITESLQKELALSYGDAERAKRGEIPAGMDRERVDAVIAAMNTEVAAEIGRSFDYFKTTSAQEGIDRLVLSGGGSKTAGLSAMLAERLGTAVESADPFKEIVIPEKGVDAQFVKENAVLGAVSVGLGLRKVGDR